MRFEWDPAKDLANQTKHGVSFEQASQVFEDANVLEIHDHEHSDNEDRFIALGSVATGLLAVVFIEPEDDVIRILSARRATSKERERFDAYWRGKND